MKIEHKKTNQNGETYIYVYIKEHVKHYVSIYFKGEYILNSQKVFLSEIGAIKFIASDVV